MFCSTQMKSPFSFGIIIAIHKELDIQGRVIIEASQNTCY